MDLPRTILSVPGSNSRMIEKALASSADAVFLDLEDAVAPSEKASARSVVVNALRDGEWGHRRRTVRINAVDTEYCYRDVIEVLEGAGPLLDTLIVPKADSPAAVTTVSMLLRQIELAIGRAEQVRLEVQIESALGLVNCEGIAQASDRLDALIFGPGDFAGSAGIPADNIGTIDQWDVAYGGHRWHYAMSRIVVAARAAGLRPIDGPFADVRDLTGLALSATMARALGYDGKWCIHPGQLETVAAIWKPSAAEIARATAILDAYAQSLKEGRGAVAFEGQMLDAASLKLAEATLNRVRKAES